MGPPVSLPLLSFQLYQLQFFLYLISYSLIFLSQGPAGLPGIPGQNGRPGKRVRIFNVLHLLLLSISSSNELL